jgi:serine/threonine protein phosphatase 1
MLAIIEGDVLARQRVKTSLIFLGDLIDRGPDSSAVLDFLRNYRPANVSTAFLMGNHEEVFLRVLEGDPTLLGRWLEFGGSECVQSYGLNPKRLARMDVVAATALLRTKVPAAHIEFVHSFADSITFGDYLLVHAGIKPGTRLNDQSQTDLRWIREPFLESDHDHGCVVVHGHTIVEAVEIRPNRIGIDTGAYKTGVLTALAIEGPQRWVLQTAASDNT